MPGSARATANTRMIGTTAVDRRSFLDNSMALHYTYSIPLGGMVPSRVPGREDPCGVLGGMRSKVSDIVL
jgi:hypothetical protein